MAGAATYAVAAPTPLFEALRWTAAEAEIDALTRQPRTCLDGESDNLAKAQIGEALFNAPALLGGQAAKAGLNCASCHVNGRDNPNFLMQGVSDRPGTADVTNSFFGAARGNGRFDPVPIPDLAQPGKVSHAVEAKVLEPFIRTLIVEEFSGHEPSPAVLDAVATYVRSVKNCTDGGATFIPRALNDQVRLIRAAVGGVPAMRARGNAQASRMLVSAARHQLGLIAERYAGPKFATERAKLLRASRRLQRLIDSPPTSPEFQTALDRWLNDFEKDVIILHHNHSASLYAPELIRHTLHPLPSR